MYHLYNKIYVELDSEEFGKYSFINISKTTGLEYIDKQTAHLGIEQLAFKTSVDDFTVKDFSDLLKKANSHYDKVIIYTDVETYLRLYSILLKTLFYNISLEQFKTLFTIFKISYQQATSAHVDSANFNTIDKISITNEIVTELFNKTEPHIESFKCLFLSNMNKLSIEWRILMMRHRKIAINIKPILKNIIYRSSIGIAHDVLRMIGLFIYIEDKQEMLGCDRNSLLDYDIMYGACKNFPYHNEFLQYKDAGYGLEMPSGWFKSLLNESRIIFEFTNINKYNGTHILIECIDILEKEETFTNCLEILNKLFNTDKFIFRTIDNDLGKYNVVLMRYVLSLPDNEFKNAIWNTDVII